MKLLAVCVCVLHSITCTIFHSLLTGWFLFCGQVYYYFCVSVLFVCGLNVCVFVIFKLLSQVTFLQCIVLIL